APLEKPREAPGLLWLEKQLLILVIPGLALLFWKGGDRILLCHPGWMEYSGTIIAHCSLELLCSRDPPSLASQIPGTTSPHHHALDKCLLNE
uniref:Uncharacterized protein n=1 Tax=Theropithecus gelada TaxID=9565 RepID=A0A8D2FCM2_THEGE